MLTSAISSSICDHIDKGALRRAPNDTLNTTGTSGAPDADELQTTLRDIEGKLNTLHSVKTQLNAIQQRVEEVASDCHTCMIRLDLMNRHISKVIGGKATDSSETSAHDTLETRTPHRFPRYVESFPRSTIIQH